MHATPLCLILNVDLSYSIFSRSKACCFFYHIMVTDSTLCIQICFVWRLHVNLIVFHTVTFHAANEELNHCHLKGHTAWLMFNAVIQRCTRRDLKQDRIVLYTLALKLMENKMSNVSVSVLILQAALLPTVRRHSCVAGAAMQHQHYALCFLNSLHKVGQPTLLQRD